MLCAGHLSTTERSDEPLQPAALAICKLCCELAADLQAFRKLYLTCILLELPKSVDCDENHFAVISSGAMTALPNSIQPSALLAPVQHAFLFHKLKPDNHRGTR